MAWADGELRSGARTGPASSNQMAAGAGLIGNAFRNNMSQPSYTPSVPQTTNYGSYRAPSPPPPAQPGPVQPIKPPAPSIEDYLGQDMGYQQQLRELSNSLAQFNGDVTHRRGSLQTEFGLSQKAMNDQKVRDNILMQDDYGARGMIHSGLFGKAVGDYNTEFGQRMSDLDRRQNDALTGLNSEQARFQSQQDLQNQTAKESAIRRRATQYGV